MDYENAENDIVNQLKAKLTDDIDSDVTIIAIPEDEREILPDTFKRQIIVAFASEEAQGDNNLSIVQQDTSITFSLLIQGKRLKGLKGLYALAAKIKLAIIGFKPTDCQPLSYGSFKFLKMENGIFEYMIDLKTVGIVVEDATELTGPPFKYATFIPAP